MLNYKSVKNSIYIIRKRKEDLMNTKKLSASTSDSIISSLRQVNNETTGVLIKDNFEKMDVSHKIYIKKISYENKSKEIIIFQNEEIMLTI